MERVTLTNGSASLELSRIVYGMWRLGDDADTSPAYVRAKIDACLAQGVTSFDQADIYGGYTAEALMGAALAEEPSLRDRMEIVTKCDILIDAGRYSGTRVKHYDTTAGHIRRSIEHSLREMRIERIDCLLIHRPDPLMDHRETGAALDEAVASGKVRTVGVSNFRPHDWTLLQSAMETPLLTNQIEVSVLSRDAFTNGDLAFLQERGITPMAWSPLGGGALFSGEATAASDALERIAAERGVDVAAIALAFLLRHPAGIVPVVGTNNLERIRRLDQALKVEMDRQTWFEILTAAQGHEVP